MLLLNCKTNFIYYIEKVEYNNQLISNRLFQLGFIKGEQLSVISNAKKSACMLVLLNGRVIAISKQIANCIQVKPLRGDYEYCKG